MKIVIINVVYGSGSTGIISQTLFDYYSKEGNNVYFLYGRGPRTIDNSHIKKTGIEFEAKMWTLFSKITGNLYFTSPFSTARIIDALKKIKPDCVHINCINGFFVNFRKLFHYLKDNNIKTIFTHHAEFFMTGNCGYSKKCNGYCDGCKNCNYGFINAAKHFKKMNNAINYLNPVHVCVSPYLEHKINQSLLFKTKAITIMNPVVLDTCLRGDPFINIRKNYSKVILYVTPNFNEPEKGGQQIFEIASRLNDFAFVVVGKCGKNVNYKNVIFWGRVENKLLPTFYKNSNLTIILSEVETFSMVVAESLCCGTPVVGFKSGGPETIALKDYSLFFEQKDINGIVSGICELINRNVDKAELMKKASVEFSKDSIGSKYLNLIKGMTK